MSYQWTKTSGPGELIFSDENAAAPSITASLDGSYTFSITAINEVGGKSTKSFTFVYDSTPPVLKDIAPILSSGNSVAITAESSEDLPLYHWEIIRAPAGVTPVLKDANSATAELSLPSIGSYELKLSLSDRAGNIGTTKVLITKEAPAAPPADTTSPTAPSAITVAAYSNSVSVSYTAGTDANFSTHNVKACAASDCSTGCLSVSQDLASPVSVSSLVNGSSYYICLQAVDLSGNVSAYVASSNSVQVDTTAPTAPSALSFSGSFSTSTTLSLAFAVGTDTNFSTHDTRLCTASDCTTGCGSMVPSATSPVNLTGTAGTTYYGCARSLDLATNASAWVASIGTMTIDSTNPTAPSAITVPAYSGSSVNVTYTAGSDLNFATHNVKACTASDCSTGCLSVTQDVASPVTVSSLVNGSSYWICLQTVDQANNTSAYVASSSSVNADNQITAPSSVRAPSSSASTYIISFTASPDSDIQQYDVKACSSSGCSTGCVGLTTASASPGTIAGGLFTEAVGYYGCVRAVDQVGNASEFVASTGTITLNSSVVTFNNLTAAPTYPINGLNLLDYVSRSNTSIDRYTQADTACTASTGTYLACIHGGEYRKAMLEGTASCTGLTITDSLGVFNWVCKESSGLPATVYSYGFKDGKGLADLINMSGTPAFRPLQLTVSGTNYSAQSSAAAWWSNTVRDIIGESLAGGSPDVLTASGVNDIFVIKSNLTAGGFNLNDNKIGLVIASGAVYSYTSGAMNTDATGEAGSTNPVAISIGSQNYNWIEGNVVSADDNNGRTLWLHNTNKARVRNFYSRRTDASTTTSFGIYTTGGGSGVGNYLDNVKASGGFRGVVVMSSYSMANNIFVSHSKAGIYASASYQYFNNVTVANALSYSGIECRSSYAYFTNVISVSLDQYGINVNGNQACHYSVLANVTSAASSGIGLSDSGIRLINTNDTTLVNVLSSNHAKGNLPITKTAQNNPNTFVNVASSGSGSQDITVTGAFTFDNRFHGALGSSGSCLLTSSPVLPGITAACAPADSSTATNIGAIDNTNLYKGPIGVDDTVNTTDNGNQTQTFSSPSSFASMDIVGFEDRFRSWNLNTTATLSSDGPMGDTVSGNIFDYRLKSTADAKVFQRNPSFVNGANCPAAVAGNVTATNSLGQTFLMNAVEIMFDDIGNDDGLCEAGEACIYTPNIGAYQGDGDYTTKSCVFQPSGGLTGITIYAYPSNGV